MGAYSEDTVMAKRGEVSDLTLTLVALEPKEVVVSMFDLFTSLCFSLCLSLCLSLCSSPTVLLDSFGVVPGERISGSCALHADLLRIIRSVAFEQVSRAKSDQLCIIRSVANH